jgi:hypothetical protein
VNNYSHIANNVKPSTGQRFVYKNSTTTQSIIDRILQHDDDAVNYVRSVAPQFKSATVTGTAKNIYNFLRSSINYVADGSSFQDIKSPGKFIETRTGDCKSYSHFTAGVLKALGIPYAYRFTSYSHGDFTHVYIVAFDENGREVIIDAVPGNSGFNREKQYLKKKDYMATVRYIAGHNSRRVKPNLRGVPVNSGTFSVGPGSGASAKVTTPTPVQEPDVADINALNALVLGNRSIPVAKALKMLTAYKVSLIKENYHLRKDYNLVVFVDAIIDAIASGNMQKVKNTVANYFIAEQAVLQNIRNEKDRDNFWNKAGDLLGDAGKAVIDFSAKVALTVWRGFKMAIGAPARTAFISLTRLNVFGLATKYNQANKRNRNGVKSWWMRMGAASFAPFEQAINLGVKEKRILGIGDGGTVTGLIAASTPVLLASISFLKDAGIDTSDMETAANSAAQNYTTKYGEDYQEGKAIVDSANNVRNAFNDATRVPAQKSFSAQIDAMLAKDADTVSRIWNSVSPEQQQVILSVMTTAQKQLLYAKLKEAQSGSSSITTVLMVAAAATGAYFIFKRKR